MKKLLFVFFVLIFGITILHAQFSSSSFASPVSLTSGSGTTSYPTGIVAPDLDGDGKPDLVITNYTNNTISVFRNVFSSGTFSSSSFGTKADYTCSKANLISTGDIDGDGNPDLAINTNISTSTLFSLFRDSSISGSINLSSRYDLNANNNPTYTAIGDIDGDGKKDLVVSNYSTGNISIFRNTGSAGSFSFASKVSVTLGSGSTGISTVAIADLDGDGKNDIVVTNTTSNTITVYKNTNSSGSINVWRFSINSFSTPSTPNFIKIDDIDGDGKKDILTSNFGGNNISIFRNTSSSGTISFARRTDYSTGSGTSNPQGSAIVDLDGDGKKDIVVANRNNNTFSVFRNTSSSGTISLAAQVTYSTGTAPCDLTSADFDGDGRMDIALTNNASNTIYIYHNDCNAIAPTIGGSSISFSRVGPTSMTLSFNKGNGDKRIVLCKASTSVSSAPVSGVSYTANSVFGNGSQIGSENYVVYSDTGSAFIVSGLSSNITYYFAVFEYNGSGSYTNYLTTSSHYITGSQKTTYYYYYSKSTGYLDSLSTWGTNTDGSGTSPSNFTTANSFYFVRNNYLPTISANMSISGGNTAFVVGDGMNTFNFSIPSSLSITTDSLVLKNNSTLTVYGSLSSPKNTFEDTTSAKFLSSSAQNIPAANYYNLLVNNSTKKLNSGNVSVRNSLTIMSSIDLNSSTMTLGTLASKTGTLYMSSGTLYGGTFERWFSTSANSGSSGLFPIGTSTNYRPVQINYTTAPTTSGTLSATFVSNTPSNTGLPLNDTSTTPNIQINKIGQNGTWVLTPVALSGGQFTASITADGFDTIGSSYSDLRMVRRANNSSAWALTGTAQLTTGSNYTPVLSRTGMNAFGEFGVGGYADSTSAIPTSFTSSSFGSPISLTSGTGTNSYPTGIISPDLDGDGKPDVVAANYTNNTISVFRNIFSAGTLSSSSFGTKNDYTSSNVNLISTGDINGDGNPDIALPCFVSTNTLFSIFLDASTSGTISLSSRKDLYANFKPGFVAIGDIDGDGKNDLVVANYALGNISIFRNTGSITTFTFAAKVDISAGISASGTSSVALSDIDGDGKLDIVVSNYVSSTITICRNTNSSGSILGSSFTISSFSTPSNPNFIKIEDIDGDGKKDILISNYGSNNISIFRNTSSSGNISLATHIDYTTGSGTSLPQGSAIVDLDGDGKKDIVVVNRGNNTFSVFQNVSSSGTISLATQAIYSTGNYPYDLTAADFDGDGKTDLALTNSGSNTLYIYRNTHSAIAPTTGGSLISFSRIGPTSMTVNFNKGNGSRRIVLCKASSLINAAPANGTGYTANSVFGNGSQIGTGNYVVYSDTGTTFTLTGLSANTTYNFAVFEYNGINLYTNYLTTTFNYITGSQTTSNNIYYYSKSTGYLDSLSTWGTNTDGSGTSPTSFTSSNSYYFVSNNYSPTISSNLSITGTNTVFVVGDGVNTFNLSIPSSLSITADSFLLKANSTLTIYGSLSSSNNTFEDTSTAQFLSSSAQNVPSASFYNLLVNNSKKTLNNGNITVRNSLIIMTSVNLNNNKITLGTSSSQTGTLYMSSGTLYGGTFKRWFSAATNSGSSGLFPIGTSINYRPVQINYTTAPTTGGTLSATFVSSIPTNTGLPLDDLNTTPIIQINKVGQNGTWVLTPSALSGGQFTASITADGFYGVSSYADLRMVRRATSTSAWALTGTAQVTTGSNSTPVLSRTGMNAFGQFGVGGDSGTNALPVKLIILTVRPFNEDAILNWQTASEINSDYFEVERSEHCSPCTEQSWDVLGKVKASGNSADVRIYQFIDNNLSTINQQLSTIYYRLKQIDKDGAITNSNIIALDIKTKLNAITLYPLPLNNMLTAVSNNNEIINELTIFDMSGRQIITSNNGQIDVTTLANGMYIVKVITDKQTYIQKITK